MCHLTSEFSCVENCLLVTVREPESYGIESTAVKIDFSDFSMIKLTQI